MVYHVNTGLEEIDDMIKEFLEELEHMKEGKSTMMGSQYYINLMEYVKKICYENNFNTIDENEDEENIIEGVRQQFEYDFNTFLTRAKTYMLEEKLDYFSIQWLENAYEYHKWNCGFGCNSESKLESKLNFIMFCLAKEFCCRWIVEQDMDDSLF